MFIFLVAIFVGLTMRIIYMPDFHPSVFTEELPFIMLWMYIRLPSEAR